jgi:hypothetical protein
MPKREDNSVAPSTNQTTAVATAVPDFMKAHIGKGVENLRSSDVAIPLLKLTQATSPQVESFDAKPGLFWHTLLDEEFPKEMRVVCLYTDQRAILWRPRDAGGGILARSDDMLKWSPSNSSFEVMIYKNTKKVVWNTRESIDASRLLEWGSYDPDDPKSPPAGTRMYNMVVALADRPDLPPAVITMQRASIRVARKLFGKFKMSPAPAFGFYLKMSSAVEEGQGQKFHNFRFTMDGMVKDEAEFNRYLEFHNMFKSMGVKISEDDLQSESEVSATVDDSSEGVTRTVGDGKVRI